MFFLDCCFLGVISIVLFFKFAETKKSQTGIQTPEIDKEQTHVGSSVTWVKKKKDWFLI